MTGSIGWSASSWPSPKPTPLDPARPVDVPQLLAGTVDLIAPEAEAARIAVKVDADAPLPRASGDAERLRQVLLNLTRNAVEAMQERGGTLTLRAHHRDDLLEIEVEDDGPGFRRRATGLRRLLHDQGPGDRPRLSLVHRIIADHGGTITVSSRPGRTCFSFRAADS